MLYTDDLVILTETFEGLMTKTWFVARFGTICTIKKIVHKTMRRDTFNKVEIQKQKK